MSKAAANGSEDANRFTPSHSEEMWDSPDRQGRGTWETNDRRQMAESRIETEAGEQEDAIRPPSSPVENSEVNWQDVNVDSEPLMDAFKEFLGKYIRSMPEDVRQNTQPWGERIFLQDDDHPSRPRRRYQSSQSSGQEASPQPFRQDSSPWVLFRAELYKLARKSRKRAILVKTVENDDHMNVMTNTRHRNTTAPIFEITTLLAAPQTPPKRRRAKPPYYSSDEDFVDHVEPIRYKDETRILARAEAGMIITINSDVIIEAIHSVATGYPDLAFDGDALIVAEPFCVLLQFRKELLDHRDALIAGRFLSAVEIPDNSADFDDINEKKPAVDADEEAPIEKRGSQQAEHISKLFNFLDQKYLEAMDIEKRRWEQPEPVCTFEWTWLLFSPGTLVYEQTPTADVLPQAFLVESFSLKGLFDYTHRERKPGVKWSRLDTRRMLKLRHRLRKIVVVATYLQHDGRKWIAVKKIFTILPFSGERMITDLPVFPAQFFDDPQNQIKERLISRGHRYHALSSRGQFEYQGQTLSGTRRWLNSRVVVDSETLFYDPHLARRKQSARQRIYDPSDNNRRSIYSSEDDSDASNAARRRRRRIRARRPDRYSGSSSSDGSVDWDTKVGNVLSRKYATQSAGQRPLKKQPLAKDLLDPDLGDAEMNDEIYSICDRKIDAYVLDERDWGKSAQHYCAQYPSLHSR